MAKVKFIHAADLHLDTPFKGLATWNAELAKHLRNATFESYNRIIDLCLKHRVDFLLISGDIFDSEIQSLAAQLGFVSGLKRLSENGIATYFICGNHDPLDSWMEGLQFPENVFRFGSGEAETCGFTRDGKLVASIQGISYHESEVNENLSERYKISRKRAPVSIALLHGSVGPTGPHKNYAPFRIEDVEPKGFDYWALGHIHKRQVVRDANPAIVYPGNPQGRDFGETGPKGCLLVEIEEHRPPGIRFLETQSIRFEEVILDLSGEDRIDRIPLLISDAVKQIDDYNDQSSYIVRVLIRGRTPLHAIMSRPGEMEQITGQYNEGQIHRTRFVLIDRIELQTRPDIDMDRIREGADFTAEILKFLEGYEQDQERLSALIDTVDREFVSPNARRELESFSGMEKKEILGRAKWLLLDHLIRETK
ncbi:MAG: DNA repair exonuclease [Bacteroidales bacterium]